MIQRQMDIQGRGPRRRAQSHKHSSSEEDVGYSEALKHLQDQMRTVNEGQYDQLTDYLFSKEPT